MAKKKAASSKDAPNFEEAIATIETIVAKLESGELDLTDSLQQYEVGIKRLRQCHEILEKAEQKVTLLSGFDADGNPVTESMPDTQFRGASMKSGGTAKTASTKTAGTKTASTKTASTGKRNGGSGNPKGGQNPLAGDSTVADVDDSAGLF